MEQFGKLILTAPGGHEQEYVLEKAQIILGRGLASDIALADAKASRTHARIECSAAGCTITDLDSANGMSINGERVDRLRLSAGDVIEIGDTILRFEVDPLAPEQDIISIDTEADLEATLVQATVPMTLTNTDTARLAIHTPNKTWEVPLMQESLSIGRHASSDLLLDQESASRHHARIERVGDHFRLRDLGSTNGTWLGVRRIEERVLRNGDTIRIGDAQLVFKDGFEPDDLTIVESRRPSTDSSHMSLRPPVVFVPGMMGSELWRGSERLWPNVKVMFTEPEVFRYMEGDAIEARGIVGELVLVPNLVKNQVYSRLGDYLVEALAYARGRDLLEFAYDWRQDLRLSARRLAETIDAWGISQPITLIAHSLGCMVCRYYVECLGGKAKVGRLLLLGGPHAGYPKAMSHLLAGPTLLPFGILGERLRQVVTTFPAMYQILPAAAFVSDEAGQPIDIFADESWLAEEQRPFLRDARAFRQELGTRSSVPTVSIFGYGLKTITGIRLARNGLDAWNQIDFDQQEVGDTHIPEASGVLAGSEIHPVQQHHGSLYVDNDVKMRLKVELTRSY